MKISRLQIKNFLLWLIITFVFALLTGWILFGAITKDIVLKSVFFAVVLSFLIQLFFKQKNKTS
jgi:hypothetical protein